MNALQRFMVMAVCLLAFAGQAQAFERQKFPKGSPQEAVEVLLYGDFMTDHRDDPAHYGYGSYLFKPKVAEASDLTPERIEWEFPLVWTYIDWYRVLDVEYIAVQAESPQRNNLAAVRVAVKVRGVRIKNGLEEGRIGAYVWPDLVITDATTNTREKVSLEFNDLDSFRAAVKSLGTIVSDNPPTIRIPDDRRNWEFRVYTAFDEKDQRWRAVKPYFPTVSSLQRAIDAEKKLMLFWKNSISDSCKPGPMTEGQKRSCAKQAATVDYIKSTISIFNALW